MFDADAFKLKLTPGKAYLLRIINAALNDGLFFAIANHCNVPVCLIQGIGAITLQPQLKETNFLIVIINTVKDTSYE